MKPKVLSIIAFLCFLAAVLLLFQCKDSLMMELWEEAPTVRYPALADAVEGGEIGLGWIPDFVPISAREIYEKHNVESNQAILCFSFDASDFQSLMPRLVELSQKAFEEGYPSWIVKVEAWMPKAILAGDYDEVVRQGFKLYEAQDQYRDLTRRWFVLVHPTKGIAYAWNPDAY